jgi:hypothetical protein
LISLASLATGEGAGLDEVPANMSDETNPSPSRMIRRTASVDFLSGIPGFDGSGSRIVFSAMATISSRR